jgi:hypothetical protein
MSAPVSALPESGHYDLTSWLIGGLLGGIRPSLAHVYSRQGLHHALDVMPEVAAYAAAAAGGGAIEGGATP